MRYEKGDKVEVRCAKEAPWFGGVIEGEDDEHYIVKLDEPQLLSKLHGPRRKRDLMASQVNVKKHLETIGLGYLHLRLKHPKDFKAK